VKRTRTGVKGDSYRYGVPENPNPKNDGSDEQKKANGGVVATLKPNVAVT
jgi:hypothetical protein